MFLKSSSLAPRKAFLSIKCSLKTTPLYLASNLLDSSINLRQGCSEVEMPCIKSSGSICLSSRNRIKTKRSMVLCVASVRS